ncbi:hypothetical protein MNBD_GAMMA05-1010 [hydrothermal vent metagenome]|uniref:Uncharacterized protein n=1 Tax=hydrothermal vent metagenome TaxID=652676 RepID=A0A3B0X3C6_9ZZZZ
MLFKEDVALNIKSNYVGMLYTINIHNSLKLMFTLPIWHEND